MARIALVYFSPTGNTEKAVSAIRELPGVETTTFDLTSQRKPEETDLSDFDFVVFGAPVYAGRIPFCSRERFLSLKGKKTPCTIVLTYGNRAYEDAPRELGDIVKSNGFRVKGFAAMVARHTYGQIQTERPSFSDLSELQNFFFRVLAKPVAGPDIDLPGNFPYRRVEMKSRFKPTTKIQKCVGCGMCIRDCPVGALEEDFKTVNDNCIGCMRCVRNCPAGAKVIESDGFSEFEKMLTEKLKVRKENDFFL